MDRADKFINNRAPRRLVLVIAAVMAIFAAADFFIANRLADRHARQETAYYLMGSAGGRITSAPDEETLNRGEELTGNGVTRQLSPKLIADRRSFRNDVFLLLLAVTVLPAAVVGAAALRSTLRTYDELEELTADCKKAADDPEYKIKLHGTGSECIRRVSEGADLLAGRLSRVTGELSSERRYLSEFLSDFSHQIKTSLAVVRLNSDMIAETKDLTPEHREKLSDEIQLNLDGMEELVVQPIKAARLDTDSISYTMKPESLTATCRKALRRIDPLLRSRGIAVRSELNEDIALPHDKGWMCEAIENILKNSADHSGCTEIYAAAERDPVTTKLILGDNGRGIPQGDIPHLFDRFAHPSADRSMKSAGLGMSIARKIVRSHGGDIYVYSEPEKGTRFELVFLNEKPVSQ